MCLDNQVHLGVVAGNFGRRIELLAIRFRGEVNAGQLGSEDPIGAYGTKKFTVSASPFFWSGQFNSSHQSIGVTSERLQTACWFNLL